MDGEYILKLNAILCVFERRENVLMFNVQLCLIFERVPVTLKFPLHSAIVTIVQKNSDYGYVYYKTLSPVQRAVALVLV